MTEDASDPRATWRYRPEPRCEEVLARLVRALRSEATHVALVGPAAAGKTSVLRELPQRLGRSFACAHISQSWLGPDEIRAWIESFAGPLPADAGTTLEDLAYAHARRGAGLALLIDDAGGMPPEVARALDPLVARTDRALRLVLVGLDDARLDAVLACFDTPFERIALDAPEAEATADAARAPALPERMQHAQPIASSTPAVQIPRDPTPDARPTPRDRTASARERLASLLPGSFPRTAAIAAVVAAIVAAFAVGRWSAAPTPVPPPQAVPEATLPDVAAPPAEVVQVHVNARPWARVSVDGREIGITPLGNVPLEPGLRRFRAELPDGRVIERDVEIGSENRRVTFP